MRAGHAAPATRRGPGDGACRPAGTPLPQGVAARPLSSKGSGFLVIGVIERYVLRTAFLAFLGALVVLTAVIWLTQALKDFDLLTLKGQSLLIFLSVTGLAIPSLVMVIAPIALFIGVLYTLNRLNGDSELIVMNAAGLSPTRLVRPFGLLSVAAGVLVAFMSLSAVPWGFHALRDLVTKIRADFITRIVREGTFATLEQNFVFHYRERGPNGSLLGIFIQDRRDPTHIVTYLAESGVTQTAGNENYLALQNGSLQREDAHSANAAIVVFKSYKIDLTQFAEQTGAVVYKPRERSTASLIAASLSPTGGGEEAGRIRSELLDRFTNPLYALTFGMIAVAALSQPRTTRQGRSGAMVASVVVVLLVRVAGFGLSNLTVRSPAALPFGVAVPLLGLLGGWWWMFGPRYDLRWRRPLRVRPAA